MRSAETSADVPRPSAAPAGPLPLHAGVPRGAVLRRSLGLVTLAWVFGSVWATSVAGAPLTQFAQTLGASNFQFGLLAAVPFVASLLSMPASLLIERTGQRKRIFLWGHYAQRVLWLPLAVLPYLIVATFGLAQKQRAMGLFIALYFVMHSAAAVGGPAWTSWMADVVPDRVRGKYFSRRRQWGILTAIPAALLAGRLLDGGAGGGAAGGGAATAADPLVTLRLCVVIFMGAAVFGIADIALFQSVPDVPRAPQRGGQLLRSFLRPLRDRQFIWFAAFAGTLTFAISFMGQFVTLYMIDKVGVSNTGTQMMVLVAPALAQLVVLPIWGRAADRMGKKPLMVIAALGMVPVGVGWCFVGAGSAWLGYALSAVGAGLWAGVEVANLNLVLELGGSGRQGDGEKSGGSSFVAVNSVIINVAGCLGGLAAGVIAQTLRDWQWVTALKTFTFYDLLFLLSAALRLMAVVVFLPHIHEPAARPTREVLAYMTANIYNNLFSVVTQPLRVFGRKKPGSGVER